MGGRAPAHAGECLSRRTEAGRGRAGARPLPDGVDDRSALTGLASGVSAIAADAYHRCALTSRGVAKCWSDNSYGALGDGTNTSSNVPVNVLL